MRLDFNVVLVDDDIFDEDSNSAVINFIKSLEECIKDKGFNPHVFRFDNVAAANAAFPSSNRNRRVDLYLSDNNLGDNSAGADSKDKNGGIEYYLGIKTKFICDFVLYTRSPIGDVIRHLAEDLVSRQDPNLFSRFTFVSRGNGTADWYEPIFLLIDHILTKREEVNNLRGLFAQMTAQMHGNLRRIGADEDDFFKSINLANKIGKISNKIKNDLHEVREYRNDIIHNDEEFCDNRKCWSIKCEVSGSLITLYESDFKRVREKLTKVFNVVMALQ